MRPLLSLTDTSFINRVESVIRGIVWPGNFSSLFHAQVKYALNEAGLGVISEVNVGEGRRLDCAVVQSGTVLALELEGDEIPERTHEKLRILPVEVLRMIVLRTVPETLPRCPHADRVMAVRSSSIMVGWLTDGRSILVEPRRGPKSAEANPLALARAPELADAARRLLNGRRPSWRVKKSR